MIRNYQEVRKMIGNINAIALDKDGVTFDSERLYAESLALTLQTLKLPANQALAEQCCGLTAEKTASVLRQHLGETVDLEHFYHLWFKHRDALIEESGVPFMAGADTLIERLYQEGYPLAMVTSDSLDNVLADFSRSPKPHLLNYFSVIITVDDVVEPKPNPEPYLRAAAYLGVDPKEMLVIEDSDYGARAAITAGCMTFLLPDKRQPDPEVAKAATKIITHHQEVLEAIYARS